MRQHSFSGRVKNLAAMYKPALDITIGDGQSPARYIHSYSTHETVVGSVAVTAPNQTTFDRIEVALVGKSCVCTCSTFDQPLTFLPRPN